MPYSPLTYRWFEKAKSLSDPSSAVPGSPVQGQESGRKPRQLKCAAMQGRAYLWWLKSCGSQHRRDTSVSSFIGPASTAPLVLALLLGVLTVCLTGCERYALDMKMAMLCEKDGGIKVYETVTLSPKDYEQLFKNVITATSEENIFGPEYSYINTEEVLVGSQADPESGRGRLIRDHFAIYRRFDHKLLGELTMYGRSGGTAFVLARTQVPRCVQSLNVV